MSECMKPDHVNAMSLEELSRLKTALFGKIKLIEETEKQLMDDTYKCVACTDSKKNISFIDGCDHVALCEGCESKMERKCCPICTIPYTNIKKLNL